ncbi:hypothetical protein, variant [Puccinia striiformis f. sp. tritici PST-78]|uniref:Uncharacterized protein n=1 Tax=Puccinia striiformis f. sp. tritici PST-78 TaxID=1165861 RepID=A0A0L0VAV9_9BASI|nr:hypothetical protein, variant [Puccinia striiformis f. sp. tritici PST-78]
MRTGKDAQDAHLRPPQLLYFLRHGAREGEDSIPPALLHCGSAVCGGEAALTSSASLTNAFAAERIHQLEESNQLVLKQVDIEVIEWGKMTIGLDSRLDDPSIHYGIGSAQYS